MIVCGDVQKLRSSEAHRLKICLGLFLKFFSPIVKPNLVISCLGIYNDFFNALRYTECFNVHERLGDGDDTVKTLIGFTVVAFVN